MALRSGYLVCHLLPALRSQFESTAASMDAAMSMVNVGASPLQTGNKARPIADQRHMPQLALEDAMEAADSAASDFMSDGRPAGKGTAQERAMVPPAAVEAEPIFASPMLKRTLGWRRQLR